MKNKILVVVEMEIAGKTKKEIKEKADEAIGKCGKVKKIIYK